MLLSDTRAKKSSVSGMSQTPCCQQSGKPDVTRKTHAWTLCTIPATFRVEPRDADADSF